MYIICSSKETEGSYVMFAGKKIKLLHVYGTTRCSSNFLLTILQQKKITGGWVFSLLLQNVNSYNRIECSFRESQEKC